MPRNADPTNEVWANVATALDTAPAQWLLRALPDAHPGPRAAALRAVARRTVAGHWSGIEPAARAQLVTVGGDTAVAGRNDSDGRVRQAAWSLLTAFVAAGPNAGRIRFLSVAKECPDDRGPFETSRFQGDAELMRALAVAARQLGPKDGTNQRPVMTAVSALLHGQQPTWNAAAVDDVITLLELGYGRHDNPRDEWLVQAIRQASEPQLARLVDLLPRANRIAEAVRQLATMPLSAGLFPHLRALAESLLDGRIPDLVAISAIATQPRVLPDGKIVRVAEPHEPLQNLLSAIHRTRAEAAAAWLGLAAREHPDLAMTFTGALLELSKAGVPTAAAELRTMLVWPGAADTGLDPESRARVFAELARLGDTAAIPLFPQAYGLGLQRTRISRTGYSFSAAGIGFLGDRSSYGNRDPGGPWHAYRDRDLVTAWRTLLESPVADQVWAELCFGDVPQPGAGRPNQNNRDFEIPQAVLPQLSAGLPARWTEARDKNEFQNAVLRDFRRIPKDAVVGDTELARALRGLLQADDTWLAFSVFSALTPDVGAVFADEARAALRRTPYKGHVERLLRAGIELPVDDWRELLRHRERNGLIEVLKGLPPKTAAMLRGEVAATLAHDQPDVRIAACQAMQRLYAGDAVPDLLPLLQDPSDDVRKAARTSLDQLREEHERRAFWANANGIDTSPAATAAKLLAQAKAGEAKDQRLLALRSLAVLGAAESLPYLIDWTKDPDAEIVAAARAAITTIHQRAAAPAEPAKK